MSALPAPAAASRPVHAIVVAAGRGVRSGLAVPKQLLPVGGRPMVAWSVAALAAHPRLGRIVVVHPADDAEVYAAALAGIDGVALTVGGETRRASVAAGLAALSGADDAVVLVHDAARPGLGAAVIDRLLAAIDAGAVGAVPVLSVADTLVERAGKDRIGAVVDRDALARVQTPQAFAIEQLIAAHAGWAGPEPTDDAAMVRAGGHDVVAVAGDARLHKLTYAGEIAMIEHYLGVGASPVRTTVGSGYDVHRLVAGKPLWLGGIEVPFTHGLSGHSDADVALHALCDAILGALAEGDIGDHFPPSDPQWKGAASHRFVAFAVDRVRQRGGRIEHLDLTILCEAPKIGPHRAAMRARIAEICEIPVDLVSVKATTTEKLGYTGRGEGIAAQAVATITLPAVSRHS